MSRREFSQILELPFTGEGQLRPVLRAIGESVPNFAQLARRNRRLAELERDMRGAANYAQYREAAIAYDREADLEAWKLGDESPLYDYRLIQRRLAQILAAREGGYVRRLMFLLQEGLHGNLGNISNPLLYQCTRFGTKRLIERYLDEVCESLEFLCEEESGEVGLVEKFDFFESTSHTFGQSALMLSGGAALGVYHLGVVKSLWQNGLLPKVISGASAGSVVTSLIGTRSDEELRDYLAEPAGILELVRWRHLPSAYLFDAGHFTSGLKSMIGEMSFLEASRHSGRDINITVSPVDRLADARLMNARTSPNVLINSAVRASCAAPFLMPPVELLAKTLNGEIVPYLRGRSFLDGSIRDDLPIRRLTRLYGVNHSIVSLVNPLVLPFASRRAQRGKDLPALLRQFGARFVKEGANISLEMLQKLVPSENFGFAVDKIQAVLMQEYRGDITLVPPRSLMHAFRVLKSLSAEEEAEMIAISERVTWPHLEMIKNTTAISRTFTYCLDLMRERVQQGRGERRAKGEGTSRRRTNGKQGASR